MDQTIGQDDQRTPPHKGSDAGGSLGIERDGRDQHQAPEQIDPADDDQSRAKQRQARDQARPGKGEGGPDGQYAGNADGNQGGFGVAPFGHVRHALAGPEEPVPRRTAQNDTQMQERRGAAHRACE